MRICIIYSSPKLGDIILQLPFIKAISVHFNKKVTLCINQNINIQNILQKQNYIDSVIVNPFRKGRFFLNDVFELSKILKQKNIDCAFILEKTKGTAIACKLAKVDKIFGFGIGSQKFLVENFSRLKKNDLRYNYTYQSSKFLNFHKISYNFNDKFLILDQIEKINFKKKYESLPKPWVCFAIDSTEVNRIWPQKNFAELADKLINKNLAKTIFVINHENHKKYFDEVISNSEFRNNFVNCKSLNRSEIIYLIEMCEFFVGIDSGPSCISGALNKKTFCIIGPTDATLPRFNSMIKIVSDIYDNRREVGLKRCGDNFVQNDSEVKTISVSKVFDTIVKNL